MKRNNLLHAPRHLAGGRFLTPKTLPPNCAQVEDAREKITISKARLHTWEAVAKWYTDEHKKAAFYRLVNDETFRPSIVLVEIIERKKLPPEMKLAECCTSCHEVHGEGLDCHNAPIAAVVILAPGERVTDAPPADAGDPARLLALVERWTAEDALEDGADVSRETLPPPRKRKTYHSRPCLSTDPVERIAQCERIIEEARRNE